MKSFDRFFFFRAVAILLLSPCLISCLGGGNDSTPSQALLSCQAYNSVRPGFSGDLNSEGAQGGDPGGGDASGSAGVGGGLGKVLGAQVEVVRLSDGLKFGGGDVFTDPQTGLVTIQTCDVGQPLLVTLKGVEGATYYDEGKNTLLPFGPDQEIHALVDRLDGNIGVSALTEAAYRYAINQFLSDPQAIAAGRLPLLQKVDTSALKKLSREQISAAHQRVLDEVNRLLPVNYKLSSLHALPTPLGVDNQQANLIPTNRYGQAAIVTGAFSWMADKFRLGTTRPTLNMLEELSRDLTDGRLNGFALDGTVASFANVSAYDATNLPIGLNVGANFMADQFGRTHFNAAAKYVDVTAFQENQSCNTTWNRFALTKQGAVELTSQRYKKNEDASQNNCVPIGAPTVDTAFTQAVGARVKEIFTLQKTGGGFLVKDDGRVFSWGNSVCGQLADGEHVGIRYEPRPIAGLNNVTSMASGYSFSIARDNEGHVYAWGNSKFGVLGLGSGPYPHPVPCAEPRFGDSTIPAVSSPQLVPGLSDITQVYVGHFSKVMALNKAGRLYSWGFGCGRPGHRTNDGGENTHRDTPMLLSQPVAVRGFAANVRGCFAVKTDGSLVGWGFYNGIKNDEGLYDDGQWFGDGQNTAKIEPTVLPDLSDVREIASDEFYFYALKGDGTLWRWGGQEGKAPVFKTPTLVTGIAPLTAQGPVKFRHIKSDLDGARLFTQDGRILVVKYWDPIPKEALEFWGFN